MAITYKLGNTIDCTIRAAYPMTLGDFSSTYDNQPFTVIRNISATISYRDIDTEISGGIKLLSFSTNSISSITLSNVLITKPIFSLI